ncbi:unnamed protein product [Calypogeia fissa]
MLSMGHGRPVGVIALVLASLIEVVVLQAQSDLQIQGPLVKPDGLCATFVLPLGLGLSCEEYVVQTTDDFLLGVQRVYNITQGNTTATKPVFLNHGILSAGDSWLLDCPANCLPVMLVDAGYEVWIGNCRTANYSSGHLTLNRTDKDFWNWSLDELAEYDLPAMLGVVSSKNNISIHYVGYSQGSQAAIAAFSEGVVMPLLDKVVLMAPPAYINSMKSILAIGADLFLIDDLLLFGVYEFDPHEQTGFMERICSYPDANCTDSLITAVTGPNCCINTTRMPYYNQCGEPTATKNVVHFAQQYRTKSFAKYDYGLLQNWEVYNSFFPPSYDISAIPSMPLLLIHGGQDGLADVEDVNLLLQQLTFLPQVVLLPDYAHMDFMIGMTAQVDCYSRVVTFLGT